MASRRRLASGAALALSALLTAGLGARYALADVVHLEGGGKIRGQVVEETETEIIVKTPYGTTHVIPVDEVLKIERESTDAVKDFEDRWAKVGATDAAGFAALGDWADKKSLPEQAKRAWTQAIAIDPDHAAARKALGFRKHKGRWYDEESYKKVVEGLVEWNGQWVTPADREFLAAGFVKNDRGEWVRAEDLERQRSGPRAGPERPAAPEPKPATPGPQSEPRRERPRPPAPPPPAGASDDETDTTWYDDHATVMTWEDAKKKPHVSRYYEIYTNIKPEYAKRYGEMLDTYSEKGFQKVFDAKNNLPQGFPKGKIYIYPDQRAFMAGEGMGESVGGYYQPGQSRVVCYHGRFGMTGTTKTVLIHEATHQFEDYVLPGKMWNAPVWIIEGFAVFFESAKYDAADKKVIIGHIPRDRLMNMKQGVSSGNYIKLPDLIRTPQPAFTGFHYAHAWSLIYYMVYGGSEKKKPGKGCVHAPRCKHQRAHNQKIFADLFFLARTKAVSPEDTEAVFGGRDNFLAFEEQWKEWILDVPYDFDPAKDDFEDIKKERERRERQGGDGSGGDEGSGEGGSGGEGTKPRESRSPSRAGDLRAADGDADALGASAAGDGALDWDAFERAWREARRAARRQAPSAP